MKHIQGTSRAQTLLLPACVDDYVGPDHVVRFIEAFVESLDLAAAGFERARPKATGRPAGYDPSGLLKLYIYGYLNRVRSSRCLETEMHRNLEVIWMMRQLQPDFKTIADFRRENKTAFRKIFREFVVLCRSLDLFGRELIAVDGTRLKAVNSGQRNFTKAKLAKAMDESDERLGRYLKQLDDADRDDTPPSARVDNLKQKIAAIKERRAQLEQHHADLEASGEDQISLTDQDARAMHFSSRIGVGYNIQIAVDTKHKLIAEQQVHNNVGDLGLLDETANAARENLGVDRIDVVADRGYYKIEDIEDCEAAGVKPYVPKPLHGSVVKNGFFTKEEFRYDADAGVLICPGGQKLEPKYKSKIRDNDAVIFVNTKACKACDLRARCTNAAFRKVMRYANEAILHRMADRLAARPEVIDQRRESLEHPFGSIKQWMGQRNFLTRRIENVRGEFSLTALAYNIRRALTLVGVAGLISAISA
ncbi:IS1182 family transposase [Paracoccus sp. JM45]|uniref:IS1182 family transposase n=1 Tax=Paracoccus sp. JM45 TaxID=2283626 RepID=UPI000E6B8715|nr:IS1182 family transposase [Paracoccus sp. JM45]RJE78568.1 IS1182 family transposase [Paracoccus sp. JM45]